jgi:hypothetical protein
MNDYERHISRESRHRNQLRRLGCNDPKCVFCGLQKPICLWVQRLPGQNSLGENTRIICANCAADNMCPPATKASRERGLRSKFRRLGFSDPKCGVCGCTKILTLRVDHLAGRKFGDDVWLVCANCHEERTELQVNEHPPVGADSKSQLEKARRVILNEADALELKSRWLRAFAETGNWDG